MLGLQAITKLERFNYIHSDITEYKNRLLEMQQLMKMVQNILVQHLKWYFIMNLLVATNSDDTRLH